MPLTVKHQAAPIRARNTPANAGPRTLALLNIMEFSAIALGRSSFPTISGKNAWRAGASKALTRPNKAARIITCHSFNYGSKGQGSEDKGQQHGTALCQHEQVAA